MKIKNLRSLFLVGMVFTTFNKTVMAQTENKHKVITRTLISDNINVSADSLWSILRAFDKVSDWTSTLDHSQGKGESKHEGATCKERVCEVNNKKLVEELTMFNEDKMELAYELSEGAPGFVKLATNHWKVFEIGPHESRVEMNVTMHLSKFLGFFLGKAITIKMAQQVSIVLSDLKIYAETGEVSVAKKAQIEKMKRKKK